MRSTLLWALAALNVLLLTLFVARMTSDNAAFGQARSSGRPGDYLMIPGEVTGGSSQVVYVVESTSGVLGAISYDDSHKRLDAMIPVDLAGMTERSGGVVTPPNRVRP